MTNNNNNNVRTVFSASNLASIKSLLWNKSGVFILINKINDSVFVGSGVNLWIKLNNFQEPGYTFNYHEKILERGIRKYGFDNFQIEILEFTSPTECLERKEHYADKIKPRYNVRRKK